MTLHVIHISRVDGIGFGNFTFRSPYPRIKDFMYRWNSRPGGTTTDQAMVMTIKVPASAGNRIPLVSPAVNQFTD